MDLLPDSDQLELVNSIRQLLRKELPSRRLHDMAERAQTLDRALWARCADGGWLGLGLDEGSGGVGCSTPEEFLLFVEIGRHLVPGPYLSTILGARVGVITRQSDLTEEILRGDLIVGLAEPHSDPAARLGTTVSGRFRLIDANEADLVLALDNRGAAIIDAAVLIGRVPTTCIDPLTGLAIVDLDAVPVVAFVPAEEEALLSHGALLTAAMLVGITQATCDLSVEYCKTREQYDQPIGAFQAVKHRCAEMAVRSEAAWSLGALASLEFSDLSRRWRVSAAKVISAEAASRNSADNVQNHGAIGITDADDAHLYVKRARVLEHVCGSTRDHLSRVLVAT